MGIIGNILLPRHDVAAKIATGVRQAHDDVKAIAAMLDPDAFPSTALNEANGLVGVDHPAIAAANQVINHKSLDKALAPRGLASQVTPQPVIDAQIALAQVRQEIAIPKGALKNPAAFGKQPVAPLQAHVNRLSNAMLEAHLSVTDPVTAKAINSDAPVRKFAAMTRLSIAGLGATAGGVAGYQAITGNDVVSPAIDALRERGTELLP